MAAVPAADAQAGAEVAAGDAPAANGSNRSGGADAGGSGGAESCCWPIGASAQRHFWRLA